jgi:hypothetical protein
MDFELKKVFANVNAKLGQVSEMKLGHFTNQAFNQSLVSFNLYESPLILITCAL